MTFIPDINVIAVKLPTGLFPELPSCVDNHASDQGRIQTPKWVFSFPWQTPGECTSGHYNFKRGQRCIHWKPFINLHIFHYVSIAVAVYYNNRRSHKNTRKHDWKTSKERTFYRNNKERTLGTVINLISEFKWSSLKTDAELQHGLHSFRNKKCHVRRQAW